MKTFMRFLTIVLSMSLALFATVDAKSQAVNQLDSLALVDFYNNCGGQNWSNTVANNAPWLQGPVSGWYGVTVSQGVVTDIQLPENAVTGMFPPYITPGALASLGTVDLRGNAMHGPFPYALGDLPVLREVDISFNQFSGMIMEPPTGVFQNLQVLTMGNNKFDGGFPAGVLNFSTLQELRLNNNMFTSVPNFSGLFPTMTILWVYNNKLDFESLEANLFPLGEYFYAPQDSLGFHRGHDIDFGSDYTIDIEVGGTGNQYQWYKDGLEIPGATQEDLLITSASGEDEGEYVCHITSTVVPDITLYTYPIEIWVEFTGQETDRMALEALYNVLDGPNWGTSTNWMTNADISSWYGVTVDQTSGRVTELNLSGNNLSGKLPLELGILNELIVLNLSNNNICCLFTSEGIGGLVNLEVMNLSANNIAGDFPEFREGDDEMLVNLRVMDLSHNHITGRLPENIWLFANLEEILMNDNQMSGPFPTGIGSLQYLRVFDISNNNYFGEIPTPPESEGEGIKFKVDPVTEVILPSIQSMNLSNNNFTGDVPAMINMFTTLIALDFSYNGFTSIPLFSDLVNLSVLAVEGNKLDFSSIEPNMALGIGTYTYAPQALVGHERMIPARQGDPVSIEAQGVLMPNNTYQWYTQEEVAGIMVDTEITGATASSYDIASVSAADYTSYVCYMSNTQVPGLTLTTKPIHLVEYTNAGDLDRMALEALYDACNGIGWTGVDNWNTAEPLSTWTGVTVDQTSGRVTSLILDAVGLMGNLPLELFLLSELEYLALQNNGITGIIPEAISDLTLLEFLQLDNNQLTGAIPPQIGALSNLQFMSLMSNQLTGNIPQEIGNLAALEYLGLEDNMLFGELPVELGSLSNLSSLRLSENKFYGQIPVVLSNLTSLQILRLDHNHFQGGIPGDFNNLSALNQFMIHNNELEYIDVLTGLSLTTFTIYNNNLDFCSIEPNMNIAPDFQYIPQGAFDEYDGHDVYLEAGATHTLEANICGTPTSHYQWYHNHNPIPDANEHQFVITSAGFYDQGDYFCEVTDTNVPRLVLHSNKYYVDVNDDPLPDGWTVATEDYQYSGQIYAELLMDGSPLYMNNYMKSYDEVPEWGALAAFVNGECRGVSTETFINNDGELVFRIDVFSNVENQEDLEFKFFLPWFQPMNDGPDYKSLETLKADPTNLPIFEIEETILFTTDGFTVGAELDPVPMHFKTIVLPEGWFVNPDDYQYHNVVYAELYKDNNPIYQPVVYKEGVEFPYVAMAAFINGVCVGVNDQPFINQNGQLVFALDVYNHDPGDLGNNSGDEMTFKVFAPDFYQTGPEYAKVEIVDPPMPIFDIAQTHIFYDEGFGSGIYGEADYPFRFDVLMPGPMLPEGWHVNPADFQYHNYVFAELYIDGNPIFDPNNYKSSIELPYMAIGAFIDGVCVGIADQHQLNSSNQLVFEIEIFSNNPGYTSGTEDEVLFKIFIPDMYMGPVNAKVDPVDPPLPIFDIAQTVLFKDYEAYPPTGSLEQPYRMDIMMGQGHELPDGWFVNPGDYQYHNYIFAELYMDGMKLHDPNAFKETIESPYVAVGAFINDVCVGINDQPQLNSHGELVFHLQYFSNNPGYTPGQEDQVHFKVFAPDFYFNNGPNYMKELPDEQFWPIFDVEQVVDFIHYEAMPPYGSLDQPYRLDMYMPDDPLPDGWWVDPHMYNDSRMYHAEIFLGGNPIYSEPLMKETTEEGPLTALAAFDEQGMCRGVQMNPEVINGKLVYSIEIFRNTGMTDNIRFKYFSPEMNLMSEELNVITKEYPLNAFITIFDISGDIMIDDSTPPEFGTTTNPLPLNIIIPSLPEGWSYEARDFSYHNMMYAEIWDEGQPVYREGEPESMDHPYAVLAAFINGVCVGLTDQPVIENGKLVYPIQISGYNDGSDPNTADEVIFKAFVPDFAHEMPGMKSGPVETIVPIFDFKQTVVFADAAVAPSYGELTAPYRLDVNMEPRWPAGWEVNPDDFQYHNMVYAEIWDEGFPVYGEAVLKELPTDFPYVVLGAFIDGVCVGITDQPEIHNGKLVFPVQVSSNNDGSDPNNRDEVYFQAFVPEYEEDVPPEEYNPIFDFEQTIMFADASIEPSYGTTTSPFRLDVVPRGPVLPDHWVVDYDSFEYIQTLYTELYIGGDPLYQDPVLKQYEEDMPPIVIAAFNEANGECVGLTNGAEIYNGKLIFQFDVASNTSSGDDIFFQVYLEGANMGPDYMKQQVDNYWPIFDIEQMIVFDASQSPLGSMSDPFRMDIMMGGFPQIPDGWVVNPAEYEFDGEITAEVFIDEMPAPPGVLAAFVNGECRGVMSEPQMGPTQKLVYIMRVYSNSAAGETIDFKYYNPRFFDGPTEGMKEGEEPNPLAMAIFDIEETVQFTSNMTIGDAVTPFEMNASSEREFNKPLNQGWTWFSVFVVTEDMSIDNLLSSLQPQDGDYIKDRKDLGNSATYIVDGENTGWYGTLTHLDPHETYKIRLTNAADLVYLGYPMDIAGEQILVEPGWNWIGYPLPFPMPVSDYLTTLNKVEGDYIKDQIESSTYYDNGGWFGTLNMMMPGNGYVINVANAGAIHEPTDIQFKSHTITTNEGNAFEIPKYSVQPNKYEFSGSATIEVFADGYTIGSESNILYAFNSNEECIGIVNGKLFPATNTYIYNLMMYSNVTEGDEISFKFYNKEDAKWYAYEETLTFEADMIVANAYHPFELSNATEIDPDSDTSVSEIYPNPFVDQLTVKFSVNTMQNIRIEAYDGQGRLIDVVVDAIFAPGEYSEDWYAQGLTEGVYFIRIIKDSGVENLKVLKVR